MSSNPAVSSVAGGDPGAGASRTPLLAAGAGLSGQLALPIAPAAISAGGRRRGGAPVP
jgi:hypothetical protein